MTSAAGLHAFLNNPTVKFSDVFSHMGFSILWSQGDVLLAKFIVRHFDQVMDVVMEIDVKREKIVVHNCISVLIEGSPGMRQAVLVKCKLLDRLVEFARHIPEHPDRCIAAYFRILPRCFHLLEWPNTILGMLFGSLFMGMKNKRTFDFLSRVIMGMPPELLPVLKDINICHRVVKEITGSDSEARKRGFGMMMSILLKDVDFDLIEALTEDDAFGKIIRMGLKEVDADAVGFITQIIERSHESSAKQALALKNEACGYTASFAQIVLDAESFTNHVGKCANLTCAIYVYSKKFDDDLRKVVLTLGRRFFELPTNTALHNVFLKWIRAVPLDAGIVKEMNLCTQIVKCYENRAHDQSSAYWGQLREISKLVGTFAKDEGVSPRVWKRVVESANKRTDVLLNEQYGGFDKSAPVHTEYMFAAVCVVAVAAVAAAYFVMR